MGRRRRAVVRARTPLDPDLVHHVADPHDLLGEVLGTALGPAIVDGPAQDDLAVLDRDLDLRGIDAVVGHEPVTDLLAETIVRALVALRAAPGEATGPRPLSAPARGATLGPRALPALLVPALIVPRSGLIDLAVA